MIAVGALSGAQAMAEGLTDILAEHLKVLFCGLNPGLAASASGHHFAGRGNRFWRTIHLAGFTPEQLLPQEDRRILDYGCGLTTVVERPTARADQLSRDEYLRAAARFEHKIAGAAPRCVAFLGKAAFSVLSGRRNIAWGLQAETIARATIWVLPNPSGRNRAFTLDQLVVAYRALHDATIDVCCAAQAVYGPKSVSVGCAR